MNTHPIHISMNKSFGENLMERMNKANLSVSQLAAAIQRPEKTVREWLGKSGRIPRDLDTLKRLSNFFKCSTHELIFAEPDPHSLISEIFEKTELHVGTYEVTVKRVNLK